MELTEKIIDTAKKLSAGEISLNQAHEKLGLQKIDKPWADNAALTDAQPAYEYLYSRVRREEIKKREAQETMVMPPRPEKDRLDSWTPWIILWAILIAGVVANIVNIWTLLQ